MRLSTKILLLLPILCSVASCSWFRHDPVCPKPVDPPTPPARVVVLQPPPCLVDAAPGPLALNSVASVTTPTGKKVQVSPEEWAAILKRDVDWSTAWASGKKCEVLPDPDASPALPASAPE